MIIAYPNFEGLGAWEPARQIMLDEYDFENLNTNQIDVIILIIIFSISTLRIPQCGGLVNNSVHKRN